MTFKPGYKRRKRTYSFRALVNKDGWNREYVHLAHTGRCDCLKMWDVNWNTNSRNIIRVTWGRRHLVILLGSKYRKIRIMGGKR
jgi:hypothetical protein